VVDAGSAGWRNFKTFKEQTIDHSTTRVLAFLNIVGPGMKGGAVEQNLGDMDPKLTAIVAKQYADYIVGIKLAHYSGPEWDPLIRTVEAGKLADMPVMIDFGGHRPHLSLERLFLEELRPGDIFTHCFANVGGRTAIVDENGKVRPYVWEAQKKGIVFDVGHGGGSFVYDQAMPAMEQGFMPNSISTDLHTGSMNAGMKSMLNVMSKLLNMGMPLNEVIKTSTWNPAKYIKHEELGHLSEGAVADIAVLNLEEGNFGFIDVRGKKMKGTQKLECELTVLGGKVVYDLNGISMPEWQAGVGNK
jgi:dihydroorotase